MNRRLLCLTSALGLVLSAGLTAAQEPKSTTERLKETANSAVQSLKKGVASAEESLREQYHKARIAAQNLNVHARVYARLRWDKGLVGAKIETEVLEDGLTTLRGTVPDAKAKAKALLLASDTVGVTQVVDHLTIQPASETEPAGTTTKTTTKETKVETTTEPAKP
jgi:hyperosmotically inducible periplasmic protein